MTASDEPIVLACNVILDEGSWVVELEFLFPDGIQRKRVGSYRSEKKARIAARWIGWAARREISRPTGF